MEMSNFRWLSELEMEDPVFIHQCQMSSFDELTTEHMAAALGDDFHSSFSSESYSSYHHPQTFNQTSSGTTFSGSSSMEGMERPTKQLKTNNSWNSCTTTLEASSSSPPNILSFGGAASPNNQAQQLFGNLIGTVKPKDEAMIFSSSDVLISQGSYRNQNQGSKTSQGIKRDLPLTKPTSHSQDHIIAERKRREKLSQRFIALSAIVPGLKKMDKASVLGDAIKYLKQLQERVKTLEEQAMKKKAMESVVVIKKSQISSDDDNSFSGENFGTNDPLPEIEARVSDKNVLIRIHCEKQKGIVVKTLAEMEKLHLCVINSSAIPFGESTLDITVVAKMEEDFSMKVKDLVRHLCSAFQQFMLE
ncbi:transcription factor bHLH18-like [Telopea speciosissima]|uniref:transcription factor bHLH18-like n=1 Tax=Telopea speciosissima TaxID=54955 RepID=UPI001CC4C7DD|nr:transcription factor bHLH18-like [Telopea speciosissima]